MDKPQVARSDGGYDLPPDLPPPPANHVYAPEHSLRTASLLLCGKSDETCETVGSHLLGAVGYTPPTRKGDPEPPARFWPVQRAVLEQGISLLHAHCGAVGALLARHLQRYATDTAR